MKTIAELKKLSEKDFYKELEKAQRTVMKLTFEARTGQLSGAHKLRNAGNYIAQINMVAGMRKNQVMEATESKKK
ncbi:50S ribosomal protein L29 [Candidatus Peregrinibacteria bacterium]|jgi:ribosomal protein L29|nr:50S ribosomal protein L29 [Candidatus Peregrinibacteria bacterium]